MPRRTLIWVAGGLSPKPWTSSPWLWAGHVTGRPGPGEGLRGVGGTCAPAGVLAATGLLLSPDIVSNKMVHFDLLHEDVSLQYFIPAFS